MNIIILYYYNIKYMNTIEHHLMTIDIHPTLELKMKKFVQVPNE